MATIRRRGNKWEVQIRRKGHRPISRPFEAKSDPNTWARQVEVSLELGHLSLSKKPKPSVTLGDLVRRYLADVTKKKRGRESEEYRLKRFLTHPICTTRMTELCERDFARYRDQRLSEVSASSVKRELANVHHVRRQSFPES